MSTRRHKPFQGPGFSRLITSLLAILASGIQCIEPPSSPILPTLDVQGSIPLLDRRLTVADFAAKDSALTEGLNGSLVYASSQTFNPIGFDTLKVQPKASTQQVVLGTFQVEIPSIPPADFDLGLPSPPNPYVVPAGSVALPAYPVPPLPGVEYIEFASGTLTLEVQNDLPVDVSFPSPLLIKNNVTSVPVDTAVVASFNVSGTVTANGGSQMQAYDLAGVRMQSLLRIPSVTINTPGGSGTISSPPRLRLLLTITNATVQAAKARMPSQSVTSFADSTFAIDDSVSLSSAYFRTGSFSVVIQNNVDLDVGIYVQIAELQDAVTGVPYQITHTFNGIGTLNRTVDMSTLKFQSAADTIGTQATFTIGISGISNSDSSREIRSTDNVQIQIVPGPPLVLQSVTGRITPTAFGIQTGASGFSLGEVSDRFQGDFSFDSLSIALALSSSSGFVTDYDLHLVAMNRRVIPNKIDSLVIPPPSGSLQRRFFPSNNMVTNVVLDNTTGLNTFLSKFFPNLPDTFIVRGGLTVNPIDVFPTALGKQTIYDTSSINSSVDIRFPLSVGIMNGSVWDTVDIASNGEFPTDFATSSQQATMFFDIENGIPLSFLFRAALLKNAAGGLKDTLLFIPTDGPRLVDAAAVDGNGEVTGPGVSRFSVTLTGPDLQQFGSADLMWIELNVETSNGGSVVTMRTTEMIKIRASANIVYRIKGK